jgi:hypothetical protein
MPQALAIPHLPLIGSLPFRKAAKRNFYEKSLFQLIKKVKHIHILYV